MPQSLSVMGIATAITYLLGVVGYTFITQSLPVIAIGLESGLLAPIWYIWLGRRRRQTVVAEYPCICSLRRYG